MSETSGGADDFQAERGRDRIDYYGIIWSSRRRRCRRRLCRCALSKSGDDPEREHEKQGEKTFCHRWTHRGGRPRGADTLRKLASQQEEVVPFLASQLTARTQHLEPWCPG